LHLKSKKGKKINKTTPKGRSPIVLAIAPAPVHRGVGFTRKSGPRVQTNSTSCHVRNQTIIPFSRANATDTVTLSTDVIAANATTFPFLSGIATRYDKVKWHKLNIRFVSALPTTSGGTVSMYFDNDRKDVGATTIGEAMQNNHCTTHPVWKEFRFNLTKQMLRSHEMFTTASGADATAANAENSFAGPGRVHLVSTPLTGVTFTTATIIGYLHIDYHAELCFPSSPQTGVPSRRSQERVEELGVAIYDHRHVRAYENFAAGCVNPPSFYQFLNLFDEEGNLNAKRASLFKPDQESFDLLALSSKSPEDFAVKFSGLTVSNGTKFRDGRLLYEEVEEDRSVCNVC